MICMTPEAIPLAPAYGHAAPLHVHVESRTEKSPIQQAITRLRRTIGLTVIRIPVTADYWGWEAAAAQLTHRHLQRSFEAAACRNTPHPKITRPKHCKRVGGWGKKTRSKGSY